MINIKHKLNLLISKQEIEKEITILANELNDKFQGEQISLIMILNGSVFFFADLARKLNMPIKMDTISISSYLGTESTRKVKFHKKIVKPIIENKHVLIIEDIIDTGRTLTNVYEYLQTLNPKTLEIITLADKEGCHEDFKYNYRSLFKVPNKFVVGYGFEIDDLYRQLDQIYTIEDEN
ncbi:hypoxanthine phosphoribosyltransferase [Spiroplasma cantharicola]|uniref:Hypoxanthine phosphoribosyltransferase n=1 Tax=Spiroplasma cantharicola TaxID=362837 RepID=A0A0M4KBJ5_9MOLU|nr:hypoxanthine phosphoribosyltransferase [Spiroplasma cantharicola]ALD65952.1 hypoxanthine-guanine phosphoribosyltransferase [Spiroplasma cantharicola]